MTYLQQNTGKVVKVKLKMARKRIGENLLHQRLLRRKTLTNWECFNESHVWFFFVQVGTTVPDVVFECWTEMGWRGHLCIFPIFPSGSMGRLCILDHGHCCTGICGRRPFGGPLLPWTSEGLTTWILHVSLQAGVPMHKISGIWVGTEYLLLSKNTLNTTLCCVTGVSVLQVSYSLLLFCFSWNQVVPSVDFALDRHDILHPGILGPVSNSRGNQKVQQLCTQWQDLPRRWPAVFVVGTESRNDCS